MNVEYLSESTNSDHQMKIKSVCTSCYLKRIPYMVHMDCTSSVSEFEMSNESFNKSNNSEVKE